MCRCNTRWELYRIVVVPIINTTKCEWTKRLILNVFKMVRIQFRAIIPGPFHLARTFVYVTQLFPSVPFENVKIAGDEPCLLRCATSNNHGGAQHPIRPRSLEYDRRVLVTDILRRAPRCLENMCTVTVPRLLITTTTTSSS